MEGAIVFVIFFGLIVLSVLFIWAIAGIRAGYVVGDPTLIARLQAQPVAIRVGTQGIDRCCQRVALAPPKVLLGEPAKLRRHRRVPPMCIGQ